MPITFELQDLEKEYKRSLLYALLLVIGNLKEDEAMDKVSLESFIETLRDLVKMKAI